MTRFANKLMSALRKRDGVRPAPARLRRMALRLESLEQRSMLTTIGPIGAPSTDLLPSGTGGSAAASVRRGGTVADDVVVDGRIITGENFDSAMAGDPSIVRKMPGRTSFQPTSTSPYGGSAGRDVIFGGLGSDHLPASTTTTIGGVGGDFTLSFRGADAASGHIGGVNALFADGSVRFMRSSMFDRHLAVTDDVKGENDAGAATSSPDGEYRWVRGKGMVFFPFSNTGADFGGRQINFTGLEQANSESSARSAGDQTIDFSSLFEIVEGAGATGGHDNVFDVTSGGEIRSFLAYGNFTGGVYVAAGDVNGDGRDDIIVGAGPGAPGGHVKVIDGNRLGDLGNDWLVGGTGRDNAIAVGVFDGASGVWHLRNSNSSGTPDNNHGTHVAGTIGAAGNNSLPAQSSLPGATSSIVLTFQGDRLDPAVDGAGITSGSTKVVVGVIDTGVDYRDRDLIVYIWTN